jgi:putative membrane protein
LKAASAVIVAEAVASPTPRRKFAALAGFLVVFTASGYAAASNSHGLPVVFVARAVAVSAIVLPGLSGSLFLVVLGQYVFMLDTLSRFHDGIVAALRGGGVDPLFTPLLILVVFGAGGVAGLFTIAHAVRRALETTRSATFAFLMSLIVGALRAPVLEVSMRLAEAGQSWTTALPRFGLAALLGAAGILAVDRYAGVLEY